MEWLGRLEKNPLLRRGSKSKTFRTEYCGN